MERPMHSYQLKVKICSLAAEARIIRRMENAERAYLRAKYGAVNRAPGIAPDKFWGLRNHRTIEVRREARAALLAYGFLREREWVTMEQTWHDPKETALALSRARDLVAKYGPGDKAKLKREFAEWEGRGDRAREAAGAAAASKAA